MTIDPANRDRGIAALPTDLIEATRAFEADDRLTAAFGVELAATIVDVRRGEAALFADADAEAITAAVRWTF